MTAAMVDPHWPRVAVLYSRELELWNPELDPSTRKIIQIPFDLGTSFGGFTTDGKLIIAGAGDQIEVWDVDKGIRIGAFKPPGVPGPWTLRGDTSIATTDDGVLSVNMDARHWVKHLCRLQDRDYTEREAQLLPPEADPSPPCH